MEHEYHEGKQAGENFVRAMRAFFQALNVANPKRPAPKHTRRSPTGSDEVQNGSSCPVRAARQLAAGS